MPPTISVVIPTYKRPYLIKRVIQSVFNQTYQNFEIVIVDDSPDNETEKVVNNLQDKRIKYIHTKTKTNPARARNRGVKESSPDSKYIAFLDDDDQYFPLFLEKTIKRLEEKKELTFVTTYAELRTQKGEKLPKIHGKLGEFWTIAAGNGCVLRKEIFTKQNIWYDETIVFEDLDLGFRILQNPHNKAESIPEVLYVFYCYPSVKGESQPTSFTPEAQLGAIEHFTTFTPETSSEEIEYFYKKHGQAYQKIGRKPVAWLCSLTGNRLCLSGEIEKGRSYFLKACLTYPHPRYLLYYLISLFFPGLFQNIRLKILKQKIFRGKI